MGVKATHSFLKKKGLSFTPTDYPTIQSYHTLHVDLLGSFYPLFIDSFFKHEPKVAAKFVLDRLQTLLPIQKTILYMDGNRTVEKNATAQRRLNVQVRDSKKLESLLFAAKTKASKGQRVSVSQIDAITRLSRRTFRFINDMKQTFIDTASALGWNIVTCRGEADVHIGSIGMTDEDAVVSGDSDLLFYQNIPNVIRPLAGNQMILYKKSAILQALNLSAVQWTSIGIVSGNDYDSNIKGFGIATNYGVIRKLDGETIAEIVKQYLCSEGISKVRDDDDVDFRKSINIFVFQKENILHEDGDKAGKGIEATGYRKLRQDIQDIKKKSRERGKEIRGKNSDKVTDASAARRQNYCRPVEKQDSVGSQKSQASTKEKRNQSLRYAFKEFTDFKQPVELDQKSYKMFYAKTPPKKSKRKPKKRKITSTPSSRKRRRMADAPAVNHPMEEPAKSRKVNETRKQVFALKKKHPCVTLVVGDLKRNIERAENNEEFGKIMLQTIQKLVDILNTAKRLAQLATDLLVQFVMQKYPNNDPPSNSARVQVFTPLMYGKDGGKVYQQNLLRLIISSRNQNEDVERILLNLTQVESEPTTPSSKPAVLAFQLLVNCYEQDGSVYESLDQQKGKVRISRALEMLSQVLDSELASHVKGRLPHLEGKVENAIESQLPLQNDRSLDDISKFYFTNKLLPQEARYQMTPQSSYGDSYIDITEEALVLAMPSDPLEVIHLSHIFGLEEEQATKGKIQEQALLQKGVLISKSLFRLSRDEEDDNLRKHRHGYHATVRLLGDNSSVLPYVLSGTIRTNGQVLQLMAFDTRKPKQRTTNGTPLLRNIEDLFHSQYAVKSTFSDPDKVAIVGIDLGEVVTAAASCIHFSDRPNSRRNLVIRRRALYQPTWTGQKLMQACKPKKVRDAEASIPSRAACTFEASLSYAQEVMKVGPTLRTFYCSKRVKRIKHDSAKARRGEFDIAANSLLKMVDGHIGAKKPSDRDAIFAIGLADFATNTGTPSLHTSFGRHLTQKVSSLGYLVAGVDEYYTSKKCPSCGNFVGMRTMRSLYCPACKKAYHRDVMAGENIAVATKSQMTNFSRPKYLQAIKQSRKTART